MNSVPFLPQQRPESCVPACLRMVLAANGLDRTEEDVYTCCQTDADGTLPSAAARCMQNLGFDASSVRLSSIDDLRARIAAQGFVIAFVNLGPLLGVNVIHAAIIEVIDITKRNVHVIDPAYPPAGRREWTLDLFEIAWRLARYQVLLVIPKT